MIDFKKYFKEEDMGYWEKVKKDLQKGFREGAVAAKESAVFCEREGRGAFRRRKETVQDF